MVGSLQSLRFAIFKKVVVVVVFVSYSRPVSHLMVGLHLRMVFWLPAQRSLQELFCVPCQDSQWGDRL